MKFPLVRATSPSLFPSCSSVCSAPSLLLSRTLSYLQADFEPSFVPFCVFVLNVTLNLCSRRRLCQSVICSTPLGLCQASPRSSLSSHAYSRAAVASCLPVSATGESRAAEHGTMLFVPNLIISSPNPVILPGLPCKAVFVITLISSAYLTGLNFSS